MIDTSKYEGHTEGPWNLTPEGHIVADDMTVVCNKHTKRIVETNHKDIQLIADAPKLLAEVERLRQIIQVYFITPKSKEFFFRHRGKDDFEERWKEWANGIHDKFWGRKE